MMADDPQTLLLRYIRDRSESAFRELVAKHAPLVHATALRKLNGDAAAAQDVTQEVFTLLARKAPRLQNAVLSGWLYRQACRRAANHIRTEQRRKHREKIAMETFSLDPENPDSSRIARELDAAMLSLLAADRDALVLRFLEGREFSAVGQALDITGEAARKRVNRALEKLAQTLRRKGIATAAAALGGTMSGFGETELPAGTVARISAKSLAAAPAVPAGVICLLKPLAAGVLAGSLVTVPLLAVQRTSGPSATVPSIVASPPTHRPQSRAQIPAGETSLEALIRQLKQLEAGPSTILTSLRRDALLEKIALAEIPAFMSLAKEMLTPAEKLGIYEPLLERWAAEDPDAAISFTLEEDIVGELKPASTTNVLVNLFSDWSGKDLQAAGNWLLRHWSDERLEEKAFQSTTRRHLAQKIAEDLLLEHGSDALAEFIQKIPDDVGKLEALEAIAVDSPYTGQVQSRDDPKFRENVLAFLQKQPDSMRKDLFRQFGKSWAEAHPEELLAAMEIADPQTRFDLSLGRISARVEPGVRTPTSQFGYRHTPRQIRSEETDARVEAALELGQEAGLPRAEVLQALAKLQLGRLEQASFFEWMDRYKSEVDFEELLVSQARHAAGRISRSVTDRNGLKALRWASRVRDPDLRLRLSRASFRKMVAMNLTVVPDGLELEPEIIVELERVLEVER